MSVLFDVLRAISDMRAEDMPSAHRLVLIMVANHANAIGRAWPSIGTLVRETGYGRTKIAEVLVELVERGWLRRDGSEGGPLHAATRFEVMVGQPWPEGSRASRIRPTERMRAIRAASSTDPPGEHPPLLAARATPARRASTTEDDTRSAGRAPPCSPGEHPPARAAITPYSPREHKPLSEPLQKEEEEKRERREQGFKLEAQEDPKPKRRKPETAIPDGWGPIDAHFTLGRSLGLDAKRVQLEAASFADGARAKDRRYVDWPAAFSNWLRNTAKYAEQRGERLTPILVDPAPAQPLKAPPFVYKPRFPGLFDKKPETPPPPPPEEADDEPEMTAEEVAERRAKVRAILAEEAAREATDGAR